MVEGRHVVHDDTRFRVERRAVCQVIALFCANFRTAHGETLDAKHTFEIAEEERVVLLLDTGLEYDEDAVARAGFREGECDVGKERRKESAPGAHRGSGVRRLRQGASRRCGGLWGDVDGERVESRLHVSRASPRRLPDCEAPKITLPFASLAKI